MNIKKIKFKKLQSNPRMVSTGRDLKTHFTAPPWAGTPFTEPAQENTTVVFGGEMSPVQGTFPLLSPLILLIEMASTNAALLMSSSLIFMVDYCSRSPCILPSPH